MNARSRSWVWLPVLAFLLAWSVSSTAAIDELELIVDGGASSFPTPIAYGPAAQASGQHWEFTDGTGSQTGGITYVDLVTSDTWSVTGEFWTGGGTGGDAFYVYGWATGDPTTEHSAHGQYSIAYDEFDDQIQLHHDGVTLATVSEAGMDSATWRSFQVDCTEGVFDVYLDGALKLSYNDGAAFYSRIAGDRFGFGGRDATATNIHRVRGMVWSATTSTATTDLQLTVDGGAPSFPAPAAYGIPLAGEDAFGGFWHLTPVSGYGGITYQGLPGADVWSVSGEFWSGGGVSVDGGDAFFVYAWATGDPSFEAESLQQYSVAYGEYAEQIQLLYNGVILPDDPAGNPAAVTEAGIDSSTWRAFQVDVSAGVFDIYLDGVLKLHYDDSASFYGRKVGDRFGFGGRGGVANNYHRVRNMALATTTVSDTSALAVSTEGGAPVYPTGTAFGAAVDGGAAWQLNPVIASTHGGVSYPSANLEERFDLSGEFRSGGGTGADIFYSFFWADTEPAWQSTANGQYAVSFDEFNDEIKFIYDGATLAAVTDATLDNGLWRPFQVSCDTGVFDIWLDGSLVLTYETAPTSSRAPPARCRASPAAQAPKRTATRSATWLPTSARRPRRRSSGRPRSSATSTTALGRPRRSPTP
ncbi:hypothetical protein HOK31_15325 [Candidatus Poribacteria bacterium]|nr:hypothetical protein [Candidatus Poribacteria bacterium]MBT7809495.1 hypothetical protein [Candidatus Poribacteria bacterium]